MAAITVSSCELLFVDHDTCVTSVDVNDALFCCYYLFAIDDHLDNQIKVKSLPIATIWIKETDN